MKRARTAWLFAVTPLPPLLFLGCNPTARSEQTITTGSLYEEMIDMVGLTRFPEPAYETVQFASYDRRSHVPVSADGEYRVHFVARLDGMGGTVEVKWDGEPAALRNYAIQQRHVTRGTHTLELVFISAPGDAGRPETGIDFVWVRQSV